MNIRVTSEDRMFRARLDRGEDVELIGEGDTEILAVKDLLEILESLTEERFNEAVRGWLPEV